MKQYLIFICNYHSMKCRNTQSCQFRQKDYSQFRNKQLITDFHFTESCSKDIFDFLIDAWWYLWTNCPEVILTFTKFQAPHQEFATQNLYALLWCKLHRSTSSQVGWSCIRALPLSLLVGGVPTRLPNNLSGSELPHITINNQVQLLPCFHFFVYGKLNFYANCAEVSK